jgi:hypothetical protein
MIVNCVNMAALGDDSFSGSVSLLRVDCDRRENDDDTDDRRVIVGKMIRIECLCEVI